jgi:heptosyltransferase-2
MKVTLLKILSKYPEAQLIFNYGGEKEREYAYKLYEEMNNDFRIFIDIEAKSLRELAAMFTLSDFFFGNEGGPRHISQAFDVPSFAIYPPGSSKKEWLPNPSLRFQGIEPGDIDPSIALNEDISYEDKFDLISVDEVWKRLDPMLASFLYK